MESIIIGVVIDERVIYVVYGIHHYRCNELTLRVDRLIECFSLLVGTGIRTTCAFPRGAVIMYTYTYPRSKTLQLTRLFTSCHRLS